MCLNIIPWWIASSRGFIPGFCYTITTSHTNNIRTNNKCPSVQSHWEVLEGFWIHSTRFVFVSTSQLWEIFAQFAPLLSLCHQRLSARCRQFTGCKSVKWDELAVLHSIQYCQTRNINILNRVCRELTRLSRSKHTLVNILIIDFTITKIILLMETKPNQYGIVRILTRVYSQNID